MFLRYSMQFILLAGIFLLGQWVVSFFHIPLPGSIVGMLLLFLALSVGLFKLTWFEKIAQLHLKHIVLLFIPPIVSIFHFLGIFKTEGLQLALIITLSSLVIILATAFVVEYIDKGKKRISKERGK